MLLCSSFSPPHTSIPVGFSLLLVIQGPFPSLVTSISLSFPPLSPSHQWGCNETQHLLSIFHKALLSILKGKALPSTSVLATAPSLKSNPRELGGVWWTLEPSPGSREVLPSW